MNERYEIRRKIGQGGLGTVYQAFDNQLKRDVAIKRLFAPVDAGGNIDRESTAEKLMREATALSRLNHPNIVSVFDVGVDADGGYVVMELLKGETLAETIAKGTLTLEDFHQVVIQTLEALIAAESQNMLHRDLKPSNIMVIWLPSGRFLIKVLDFGLAKVSTQPALQTIDHNNSVLGSIFYMAPEQFERRELDFRTDIYSLGCIFYFCLTGRDPFTGRSVADVMNAHLEHRVIPLHDIRSDLPPAICDWVMWLMRRDMEKRPGNAQVALDNVPLVEGSGGSVQVDTERQFAIPKITDSVTLQPLPNEPRLSPRITSQTPLPPSRATSGNRLPVRSSGPVPSRATSGNRLPPLRTSSPIPERTTTRTTTTSTRTASGPVPTRTGAAPTTSHLPGAPHLPKSPARSSSSSRFIALGAGGAVLVLGIIAVLALQPKGRDTTPPPSQPSASTTPNASSASTSIAAVTAVARTAVAEGDEIQFSFQVRHRTADPFRFALLETNPDQTSSGRGYAFEVEDRDPVSLSIKRYNEESITKLQQLPIPTGPSFGPKLEGRNVKPGQLSKVELRGKMAGGKNLSFTVTLWGSSGEKGTYKASDAVSPLSAIQVYGFRGLRPVVEQVGEKKLAVLSASHPSGPVDPSALGLTVLLDDKFDTGKAPGTGDDSDDPNDRKWEDSPWLAKPDPAKKINQVNGTNALGINAAKSSYANFPKVELADRRLIEAAFSCRIDDSIESLRLLLANKTTESRGYLAVLHRDVRITLHELRGQNGKDFPVELSRQVHEAKAPSTTTRLNQVYQVRVSVNRVSSQQTKVVITANLPGGKLATTTFTDSQGAFQFSTFGAKAQGSKGKILLDNIRIVSSAGN